MNHIIQYGLVIFLLALLSFPGLAQTRPEVAAYAIPPDAPQIKLKISPNPHEMVCNYFTPGQKPSRHNLIATEIYHDDVLVEQRLFKDKLRFGVQRKWYPNKQLKEEAPYYQDKMDGLFRHWNEQGQLIGQYTMKMGDGVVKIYNDDGELVKEQGYQNNSPNGLYMELLSSPKIRSFVWFKNGYYTDKGYDFFDDGSLRGLYFYLGDDKANDSFMHGPAVEFDKGGIVIKKKWFLKGKEISEDQYSKVAATDLALPPYYADASQYKSFVTDEVKALLKKYQQMPKIKIPLVFDAQGNPL